VTGVRLYASAPAPEWFLRSLAQREHIINQLEALAAVCALLTFGPELQGHQAFHFVDNEAAFYTLLTGGSRHQEMWRLGRMYHGYLFTTSAEIHLEVVASGDNIADIPSRPPRLMAWSDYNERVSACSFSAERGSIEDRLHAQGVARVRLVR